jgi:hypothetical protein
MTATVASHDDVTDTTYTDNTESNVDTFTPAIRKTTTPAHVDTSTYCPIRTSGQVCICDHCEAARLLLLRRRNKVGNGVIIRPNTSISQPTNIAKGTELFRRVLLRVARVPCLDVALFLILCMYAILLHIEWVATNY